MKVANGVVSSDVDRRHTEEAGLWSEQQNEINKGLGYLCSVPTPIKVSLWACYIISHDLHILDCEMQL
jgi:hypothetical protein